MSTPPISFELRGVHKARGAQQILRDVTLAVRGGEHTAILGPSGSGKSTVLRVIAGLEDPTRGDVFVCGVHASAPGRILLPPHERRLAMVFQDLGLWPSLTVFDNVLLGLDGSRLPATERRRRAEEALVLCGIPNLASRLPGSLSGGEQQRLALARALAPDPAFLLLDEPFAGLDLDTKMKLLGDLRELARERKVTACLVTHDPGEAFGLCTHAVLLADGAVCESGPWSELLCEPRSSLLKAFQAHYDVARSRNVRAATSRSS